MIGMDVVEGLKMQYLLDQFGEVLLKRVLAEEERMTWKTLGGDGWALGKIWVIKESTLKALERRPTYFSWDHIIVHDQVKPIESKWNTLISRFRQDLFLNSDRIDERHVVSTYCQYIRDFHEQKNCEQKIRSDDQVKVTFDGYVAVKDGLIWGLVAEKEKQ